MKNYMIQPKIISSDSNREWYRYAFEFKECAWNPTCEYGTKQGVISSEDEYPGVDDEYALVPGPRLSIDVNYSPKVLEELIEL